MDVPRGWRFRLGVFTLVAAILGLLLASQDELTLQEQAARLHEVEPEDVSADLRLDDWSRDGLVLRAQYEGEGSPAGFTLRLWADESDARDWFRQKVRELSKQELAAEINASEYCFRVAQGTRCVGNDSHRTYAGKTTGHGDSEKELDARLLIRIARKHWYLVFG